VSQRLSGTIVPLLTPFAEDESLDAPGLRQLVEFVLEQGADGLMPTALTGEGPLLTADERLGVWDVVFEAVDRRVPVVPAVISTTTREAVRLVRAAEQRGAAAVMVAPILPELYAARAHDDIVAFHAEVADATALPLLLFNYPSLTGVDLTPPLVARLAEIPRVAYIKESSGDVRRVHAIQRLVGERVEVVCGAPNVALESLALGCRAWITGILNAAPRSGRQLVRAVRERGDLALARAIYATQILPLVDVIGATCNPVGTIKAAVRARGVAVGVPRRPGRDLDAAGRERLLALMAAVSATEAEVEGRLSP